MKLLISLNEDLARALHELADWEQSPELQMAADLTLLALQRQQPQQERLRQVARLTERERELAAYLAQGWSVEQIRQSMSLSKETIKTHLRNIRLKLEVRSLGDLREALRTIPPTLLGNTENSSSLAIPGKTSPKDLHIPSEIKAPRYCGPR